ncbi:MAG: hypothetical protein KH284_07735 [Clostridiales bacterium]|nr:hypothetical protein [Clostridiales bacterium]
MKTKLTKLFSLLMAGALVLSLAACSGAGDDANTTGAEESNQAPNASETFTPESDASENPSDSTSAPGVSDESDTGSNASTQKTNEADTTKTADNQQKPDNNASKAPSGVNEIVSYYNAAVKKIAKVSGNYSRKITSGSVSVVNLNLTDQKYAAVINRNNTALTSAEAALKSLSASDVSSASCKESGNNYVCTISLKNKSGKDSGIKHGAGGYMYFAELGEIEKAVYDIGVVLGVKGIKVSTANLTLSNGKLTITIDKASGKISNASLTFTENVDATAKYSLLKPAAKLSVNFTVNYTAS